MAKLTNPMLLIALLLVATASVSKCQVQILGRRLTCMGRLPFLPGPALSGGNATLSCDGGATTIANATTTATGDFNITVNPVPTTPPFFPVTCTVFIAVPSNCTISLFRRVNTLRSLFINPSIGQPSVISQITVFEAGPFVPA